MVVAGFVAVGVDVAGDLDLRSRCGCGSVVIVGGGEIETGEEVVAAAVGDRGADFLGGATVG